MNERWGQFILSLLLVVWVWNVVAHAGEKFEIQVRSHVYVSGETVHMRDLVPEGVIVPMEVAEIIVGDFMKSDSIQISNVELSRILASMKSSKPVSDWQERVRLIFPKGMIAEKLMWKSSHALAREEIATKLMRFCLKECQVEVIEFHEPKPTPTWGAQVYYRIGSPKNLPRGSFSIEATAFSDEKTLGTFWISGRIQIMAKAAVAKRFLKPGDRIMDSDLEIKRVDVTMLTDTAIDSGAAVGKSLTKPIPPGTILTESNILREKDVIYGQPVQVILVGEEWRMVADGVSRESASVGDRVKVYISSTKKIVSGVLVAKGVVEVR